MYEIYVCNIVSTFQVGRQGLIYWDYGNWKKRKIDSRCPSRSAASYPEYFNDYKLKENTYLLLENVKYDDSLFL